MFYICNIDPLYQLLFQVGATMNELMHKSGLELPTESNNMDRIKAHKVS